MQQRKTRPRPANAKRAALPAPAIDKLRPWLLGSVTMLLVARPLVPSEASTVRGYGLPFVICWLLVLCAWALDAVWKRSLAVRCGWPAAAVLALVTWHSISAIVAVWTGAPRPAINLMWEWLALGAAYWLVRQLFSTGAESRALAGAMLALAVSLSAYGYYQYAVTMPQTRQEFEADEDAALRAAGIATDDARTRQLFRERLYSTEPLGTFELTNSLAGFLAPWLIVAVGLAFAGGEVSGSRRRAMLASACIALLIGGCLLLTKSRSAYLAASVGIPLAWLSCRPAGLRVQWKWLAALAGVIMLLVIAGMVAGSLDLKVLTEASKSLGYRTQYWQSTLRMIGDHPWLGVGPGNFGDHYPQYKLETASEEIQDPHNFLLEIWATAGTPALAAMIALLGLAVCRNWQTIGQESLSADGLNARPVFIGALAALPIAYFMGLAVDLPPTFAALIIAVIAGTATVAALHAWIQSGSLPRLLPGAALVVLCVNLLAAGGIGFPGVAGTFWLLLALSLNFCTGAETVQVGGRNAAIFSLAIAALLLAACGWTAYLPVMNRLQQMSLAERDPMRLPDHLHSAASADPWSADPWIELAQFHLVRWRQSRAAGDLQQFEASRSQALALRPRASELWLKAGDWHRQAWQVSADPAHLQAAIAEYRRSVALYPHSAVRRAKLAIALRDAGEAAAAQEQRTEAVRLDALTPHADQKLSTELRAELLRNSAQ